MIRYFLLGVVIGLQGCCSVPPARLENYCACYHYPAVVSQP